MKTRLTSIFAAVIGGLILLLTSTLSIADCAHDAGLSADTAGTSPILLAADHADDDSDSDSDEDSDTDSDSDSDDKGEA